MILVGVAVAVVVDAVARRVGFRWLPRLARVHHHPGDARQLSGGCARTHATFLRLRQDVVVCSAVAVVIPVVARVIDLRRHHRIQQALVGVVADDPPSARRADVLSVPHLVRVLYAVARFPEGGPVLVGLTVTVVVLVIAGLRCPGVHGGVTWLAIRGVVRLSVVVVVVVARVPFRVLVAVRLIRVRLELAVVRGVRHPVAVRIARRPLVGLSVAVIVLVVAELRLAGRYRRVAVMAVAEPGALQLGVRAFDPATALRLCAHSHAVAVAVRIIDVAGDRSVVLIAVFESAGLLAISVDVVVTRVAHTVLVQVQLVGVGDLWTVVVAPLGVALRTRAIVGLAGVVAVVQHHVIVVVGVDAVGERVAIQVGEALIGPPVAVVVEPIADLFLGHARVAGSHRPVHAGVGACARPTVARVRTRDLQQPFVGLAVAVVVFAVADLLRGGLIGLTVAVVVLVVASLVRTGMDSGVTGLAVEDIRRPVVIVVVVAGVPFQILVAVLLIRVGGGLAVVDVVQDRVVVIVRVDAVRERVAIQVREAFIGVAVAIVVHVVAGLFGLGMHSGVTGLAVGGVRRPVVVVVVVAGVPLLVPVAVVLVSVRYALAVVRVIRHPVAVLVARRTLVGLSVAVIVFAVAELRGPLQAFVDQSVAVVICQSWTHSQTFPCMS